MTDYSAIGKPELINYLVQAEQQRDQALKLVEREGDLVGLLTLEELRGAIHALAVDRQLSHLTEWSVGYNEAIDDVLEILAEAMS